MSFSSDIPLQSNQLPISIEFPNPDDPDFLTILDITYKRIVNSVNTKEGALYLLNELANFKQYYTQGNPQVNRNSYRKTFDMVDLNGAPIGAGATVSKSHNIIGISDTAIIYAGCTSPSDPTFNFFSVMYPYAYLTTTNVVFVNPLGSIVTKCNLVAEYLKN